MIKEFVSNCIRTVSEIPSKDYSIFTKLELYRRALLGTFVLISGEYEKDNYPTNLLYYVKTIDNMDFNHYMREILLLDGVREHRDLPTRNFYDISMEEFKDIETATLEIIEILNINIDESIKKINTKEKRAKAYSIAELEDLIKTKVESKTVIDRIKEMKEDNKIATKMKPSVERLISSNMISSNPIKEVVPAIKIEESEQEIKVEEPVEVIEEVKEVEPVNESLNPKEMGEMMRTIMKESMRDTMSELLKESVTEIKEELKEDSKSQIENSFQILSKRFKEERMLERQKELEEKKMEEETKLVEDLEEPVEIQQEEVEQPKEEVLEEQPAEIKLDDLDEPENEDENENIAETLADEWEGFSDEDFKSADVF